MSFKAVNICILYTIICFLMWKFLTLSGVTNCVLFGCISEMLGIEREHKAQLCLHDLNPNYTGLFSAMKILGGGALEAPHFRSRPKGADHRKIWHAPQKLCKEKNLSVIFLKNFLFY